MNTILIVIAVLVIAGVLAYLFERQKAKAVAANPQITLPVVPTPIVPKPENPTDPGAVNPPSVK